MKDTEPLQDLVEEICARGRITDSEVLALRRQVFPDGLVSEHEAAAVFRLDHACAEPSEAWTRLYCDALTDYFVWQSQPRGYVSDAQADRLIAEISRDGRVNATSEMELLVNIVHWCTACPEALALLALRAVRDSVLDPPTACYGSNRPPAVITPSDVELIRRVIYAPGSPGGFTVTRAEAELLFELDRASDASENAAGWPELFAKGVANALMFPRGAPVVPDAAEAARRERWLEERGGIGQLLAGIGGAAARGDVPFGEVFGPRHVDEAAGRSRVAESLRRESIDAEEARWLVAWCGDATPSDGVVRLLRFIRENAPSVDPAIHPLFARAGV